MNRRASAWAVLAGAIVLGSAAVFGCRTHTPPAPPPAEPRIVSSNIERRDYAGSAACVPCHGDLHAKWIHSPMRNMTRSARDAGMPSAATDLASRAPFDGSTFHFKGDSVTMEESDGRRFMRVVTAASGEQLFRVTKVIGGRYREDYAGVLVDGTGPDAKIVGDPREEPVLPVSYLLFAKRWRYKGYSVMVHERAHVAKHGAPWRQTCIFCHNTEPYLATIYDDLRGGGRSYQGSVSDAKLPSDRLWKAEVADAKVLARAVGDELAFLKASPASAEATTEDLLDRAIDATHDRFGESELVEVGIGCEACHNGARQHVQDPTVLPTFEPRSPLLRLSTPGSAGPTSDGRHTPTRAERINHVCARCHTVLFSRYPYTWEGGLRAKHPGGSSINSGEARDFLLGSCTSNFACTSCHDPHTEDARADLDRMGTVSGNVKCTGCHARYADPADRARHTHHAPEGDGSACLSCHMPKKNAGLSYRFTRYHRIGSPTDAERVLKDRPIECALCHATKTVEELTSTMEQWWHKRYDRRSLRELYGDDLDRSPVTSALRGRPHEQMLASGILAEHGSATDATSLLPLLVSDYPLVRYWAGDAMGRLLHEPLPVDLDGESDAIAAQASSFLEAWEKKRARP